MIKEVLRLSREEHGGSYLWLADTYDTLPDYNPDNPGAEGTLALVDPNWRSPFVGSSVEAVAAVRCYKGLCQDNYDGLPTRNTSLVEYLSLEKVSIRGDISSYGFRMMPNCQ
jgi:hypothetical protein